MGGRWGLYPWFIEHGTNLIHPEDLEDFQKISSNIIVFECVEEGEYLTLRCGQKRYRVKEELFCPVPPPRFDVGQRVIIKDKNMEAVILGIAWHYNRKQHYYVCAVSSKKCESDGVSGERNAVSWKKLKKRYFSFDLLPADF